MVVYDEEFFPNVFLLCAGDVTTRKSKTFEISDRRDDREEMFKYMRKLYADKTWMVGFNSLELCGV